MNIIEKMDLLGWEWINLRGESLQVLHTNRHELAFGVGFIELFFIFLEVIEK